jgi:hypothetical protein
MIIKWIDLALSRLKQGFDSPRERQSFQWLIDRFPISAGVVFNFSPTDFRVYLKKVFPLPCERQTQLMQRALVCSAKARRTELSAKRM